MYIRNFYKFVLPDFTQSPHGRAALPSGYHPPPQSRGKTIGLTSIISVGPRSAIGESRGVLVVVEGTSTRLTSLNPFTNYSVTVSAATAAGVGVASDPLICTTIEDGKT